MNYTANIHNNVFTNLDAGDNIPCYDTKANRGIYLGGQVTIYNNLFHNNNLEDNAVIYLRSDSSRTHLVAQNTLADNLARGGSIASSCSVMKVYNNIIANSDGVGVGQWDPYGSWNPDIQSRISQVNRDKETEV